MLPKLASQICTAFCSIAANTGCGSPGELLIIRSTSEVAVCCSNASRSSLPSRATSVSLPTEDEMERATAFGALLRFGFGVFRRRPLIASPPALERGFIAYPVGSREGIVAGQSARQEVAYSCHSLRSHMPRNDALVRLACFLLPPDGHTSEALI